MSESSSFKLQLLHASDQEAGVPALESAPNFSAVLNALKNADADSDGTLDYPNTLVLSSGDAYIPSPFFFASETAFGAQGRGDILIQNELGFQAIAFGNHEFDLGTGVVADLIQADAEAGYPGTAFPYLSSNLDFSTDEALAGLVVADGQPASEIPNSIAGSTIITVNGEKIGVVGATTPTLPEISSPGGVTVLPEEFDGSDPADVAVLAAEIQASVDELIANNADLNKVILLAHMQQIAIEEQLAELLSNVDVIVAGGSNTLLADDTDRLQAGDEGEGVYPILSTAADGNPIAVVNTDGNYKYVGRLVVDFDENGVIIPESIDPEISGAYATDAEGVAAVNGTPDPEIVAITDALEDVILEVDGNLFGNTAVFLNGIRSDVRTQETNLGNLTADANLTIAQQSDPDTVISIKNGGGIRDSIGLLTYPSGSTDVEDLLKLPPQANPVAGKEEGDISQLDISNALRFNNGLSLLTLTAEELAEVIEYGVSASESGATPGQFPQVSGLSFSFDPDLPAGDRVQSLAVLDAEGNIADVVIENGEIVGDPARTFRTVTLNFLASGGDGYPFPDRDRVDLVTEDADNPNPTTRTGVATFAPDGSEQDALAEYLATNFGDTPFAQADVPPEEDTRIQNLNAREDTVLDGDTPGETPGETPDMVPISEIQGAGHVSEWVGQTVMTTGIVIAVDTNGFYLQDAVGDGNDATSDGIFVFTGDAPTVTVGDAAEVTGSIAEFIPGGASTGNLSITQLSGDVTVNVLSSGNELPAAVILGSEGRTPPTEIITNDGVAVNLPLEEAQEVSPVADTAATGNLNATLNGNTLEVTGSFSELSSDLMLVGAEDAEGNPQSAAHIHLGNFGINGPILRNLTLTENEDGTGSFTGSFTLTDEELAEVLTEGIYVNLHTMSNPSGELRGQIVLDQTDPAVFDPAEDGIDFYETLEGMRVTVQDALAVSPVNEFGEIFTVADEGINATGLSDRGTINISQNDFNPERIQVQIDSGLLPDFETSVNAGDQLGDVTGVVGYSFGNYEVNATEAFTVTAGDLQPEVTELEGTDTQLTIASYNVLNLDPRIEDISRVTDNDPDEISDDIGNGQFAAIAEHIVNNLRTPDIIALQEIQDNDGAELTEIVDASETYQALIDAITTAGGPEYAFFELPPENGQDGGQPGGNIRVGYLYQPDRVELVEDSVQRIGDDNLEDGDAFEDSRKSLVARFRFNGEEVTVINNHFTSKGGSTPLFGSVQPPINGGEAQRIAQAQIVKDYVDSILTEDADANVVVLGDLNEFEFFRPLEVLAGGSEPVLTNLTNTLPENERYSYIFQGNSQSLDHILVSDALAETAEFDAVHVNSEFADQASDHDPLLARLTVGDDDLTGGTGSPWLDAIADALLDSGLVTEPVLTAALEDINTALQSDAVQDLFDQISQIPIDKLFQGIFGSNSGLSPIASGLSALNPAEGTSIG